MPVAAPKAQGRVGFDRPELTPMAKELVAVFNWFQRESSPMAKGVSKLRNLYDALDENDEAGKKEFFKLVVFMIQLPLTSGSVKEGMAKHDEKILDTVCKFAVSFFQDALEANKEKRQQSSLDSDDEEEEELPPFLHNLFDWLLDHHNVEGSQARLRICLMVNRLLRLLGEDATIDEDLAQRIFDNMLERLKDKVAEIRAQAVTALMRLQDPRDDQCPIIRAFIFHLGSDPSPLVRRMIVRVICANRLTLTHVVKRTLDIDEQVRRAAYKFIADKIHIKSMTIAQREEIIRRGLTDRNEKVKKVVAKDLVPAWLKLCNDNLCEFLYALDVGNSGDGKTAREVLTVIFKSSSYKDLVDNLQNSYLDPATKLVPKAKLSPETAVYWSNLAKYLHDESETQGVADAAGYLDAVKPELTCFVKYLREYIFDFVKAKRKRELAAAAKRKAALAKAALAVENGGDIGDIVSSQEEEEAQADGDFEAEEVAWLFACKQLIEMTSVFDLSDEAGRNNLAKLCRDLLSSSRVSSDFTDPVTRVYSQVQTNANARIQDIAEIIAELREPLLYGPPTTGQKASEPAARGAEGATDDGAESGIGGEDDDRRTVVDETLTEDEEEVEEPRVLSKAELERKEAEHRKKQVAMAKVRVNLNILKTDLQDAIQNQDFFRAQELKVEIDKLDEEQNKLQDELTEAAAMAPKEQNQEPKKKKKAAEQEPLAPVAPPAAAPAAAAENADPEVVIQEEVVPFDELYVTHKGLEMLCVLLESTSIKSMNGTLQALLEEFILPSLKSVDSLIRMSAVKAVGACCLRSLDAAKRHILVILQVVHLDVPEVRMWALKVIYDLLMWHGLQAFMDSSSASASAAPSEGAGGSIFNDGASSQSQGPDTDLMGLYRHGGNLTQMEINTHGGNSVVAILSQLLDDPDLEIRTVVTEGLCKLLLCGAIASPKLFSRLILIWYNPMTEADGKLRHMLGAFFPLYASFSKTNQDSIEESFMMTLNTLIDAPTTSPLAEVDLEDVGNFYLHLTRADLLQNTPGGGGEAEEEGEVDIGVSCHDSMAVSLCNKILDNPGHFYVKFLVKILTSLQVTPNNYAKLREIKELLRLMLDAVSEKLILKPLEKYGARLDELIALDPSLQQQEDKNNETTEGETAEAAASADETAAPAAANATMAAPATGVGNVTKFAAKKRALFNETCNTLLDLTKADAEPPGSPSRNRLIPPQIRTILAEETASSSAGSGSDDVFKSPPKKAPKTVATEREKATASRRSRESNRANSPANTRKERSGDVTRVDESEEESEDAGGQNTGGEEEVEETEEEEEEEVVSGNILAKRKNKPPRTSNDNSKEMPSMLASTVIQAGSGGGKPSGPRPKKASVSPIRRTSSRGQPVSAQNSSLNQSQRLTVEDQTPRRSSRSGSVGSVGARSGSQEPSEKTTPKGAPAKATPKAAPTRATPKAAATKATPNTATKASGKKQRGGSKNLQPQCDTDDDLRTPSSGSLRRTSTRRADSSQSTTPASIGKATKPKNAKKAAAVQTATSDDTEDDDTTPPASTDTNSASSSQTTVASGSGSEEAEVGDSRRRPSSRRAAANVGSLKEPSGNKKLRQGDPTSSTIYSQTDKREPRRLSNPSWTRKAGESNSKQGSSNSVGGSKAKSKAAASTGDKRRGSELDSAPSSAGSDAEAAATAPAPRSSGRSKKTVRKT